MEGREGMYSVVECMDVRDMYKDEEVSEAEMTTYEFITTSFITKSNWQRQSKLMRAQQIHVLH